jgi:predicted transcriptional regulator
MVRRLQQAAQMQHESEETIITQALRLFLNLEDASPSEDYWFSVAAMREDWDAMPEDWIADEVNR